MAARLQYDISVIGQDRFKRVMRGVGAELKALDRHASAVARHARTSAAKQARATATGTRGIAGLGHLGEIAKAAKLQQAEEMKRHRAAFRNRQKEARQALTGISRIGQAARREEDRRHTAAIRHARSESRARQKAASNFGRGSATTLKNAGRNIIGIGGTALGVAGVVGGVAAGSAVADEIEVRKRASQLANQAGTPEIKDQLAREARAVTGFSGTEALAGLEAFVDLTGNLDVARKLLPDLGKLALATGTDLAELAATAGNAFIPLSDQIEKPAEQLEKMREVMAALAGQGAIGAVEIKDFAKEFAGLAAVSNIFGGDPAENLKLMGAFAQATRQRGGAESASEAVTAVTKFGADVTKTRGQKALKKLGIDVFADEGKTQLKDPRQIMLDVLEKTKGDLTKVNKIFGERGIKTLRGFAPVFTQAERKEAGTGRAAVEKEFDRFMNAQLSTEDVAKRAASREKDADVQLVEASKKFNEAVGTKLLPVITRLIPKMAEMIPSFAELAEAVASVVPLIVDDLVPIFKEVAPLIKSALQTMEANFGGVGTIIAAVLAKEIVLGGVASLTSSAVTAVMTKVATAVMGLMGVAPAVPGVVPGVAPAAPTIGKGITKLGAVATSALGVGGATVAAGGLAAAAVGAAIYNGFKLFQETGGFTDFGGERARVASGDDYDRMMREAGIEPGTDNDATAKSVEASNKTSEAADKQMAAADKMAAAADTLAANNPRRTDGIHIR